MRLNRRVRRENPRFGCLWTNEVSPQICEKIQVLGATGFASVKRSSRMPSSMQVLTQQSESTSHGDFCFTEHPGNPIRMVWVISTRDPIAAVQCSLERSAESFSALWSQLADIKVGRG